MTTFFRLVGRGVSDLSMHPWAQALTLGAVTLVAFLAGLFLLFLHNLETQLTRTQGAIAFQVYWEAGADMSAVRRQWEELRKLPGLTDMETFTPEQALARLGDSLNKAGDFSWLQSDNPLPATALLSFRVPEDGRRFAEDTRDRLRAMDRVASVHYNPLQLNLAQSWARLSRRVVVLLVVFLGVVAGLTVGNTIKLSLYSRRDEVEILHLVGATSAYIRLPLLVGGAVQGLAGGALALGLLKLLQLSANALLSSPPLLVEVDFLPALHSGALVAILTGVCILASYAAVRR